MTRYEFEKKQLYQEYQTLRHWSKRSMNDYSLVRKHFEKLYGKTGEKPKKNLNPFIIIITNKGLIKEIRIKKGISLEIPGIDNSLQDYYDGLDVNTLIHPNKIVFSKGCDEREVLKNLKRV